MTKISENEKINRAINFIIIALIWKQHYGKLDQKELTKKFELGMNAYTKLRNEGYMFNSLGIKRCSGLAKATGVERTIFDGGSRLRVRGIEYEEFERYLYTLKNIQMLKETISIVEAGQEIKKEEINKKLRMDLSTRMLRIKTEREEKEEKKKDMIEEIKKVLGDRKQDRREFEDKLNKIIRDVMLHIGEMSGNCSPFEKLVFYIHMERPYERQAEKLEASLFMLKEIDFNTLKDAPLSQLEPYVDWLREQFRIANALLVIKKEEYKKNSQ